MKTSRLLTALLTTAAFMGGCTVHPVHSPYYEQEQIITVAPPPPLNERPGYQPSPGHIWISGYWNWVGVRYVWVAGRWDAPRPGYLWVPHRWERAGDRWRQYGGQWERDARPPPRVAPPQRPMEQRPIQQRDNDRQPPPAVRPEVDRHERPAPAVVPEEHRQRTAPAPLGRPDAARPQRPDAVRPQQPEAAGGAKDRRDDRRPPEAADRMRRDRQDADVDRPTKREPRAEAEPKPRPESRDNPPGRDPPRPRENDAGR
ncbi:MAG: YXWGXW repeat-containing protein [Gammaproteobacteria bacterium]|nr:YXWGXW repeat-containing protein [Gammaproteobacteria bacterium]MBU1647549.1 YXWGXW repeat-containing protein [Gammaproteobacteria bacterium]MBU1972998.1 YXWGXW repeat-containing protein [Gammaproteobacteria bacterium]